jgi:hypothetical protein
MSAMHRALSIVNGIIYYIIHDPFGKPAHVCPDDPTVFAQKRNKEAPTSASPDTANASLRGDLLPCTSSDDAAAVDC